MKLRTLAAVSAAFVSLSVASAALAGETVTAKLQQPIAEKTKFIAGGAMFLCEGDACIAKAATPTTFATNTCKAIAAKVGPVAAFSGRKALDDGRLADCNAKAMARAEPATTLAKQ